MSDDSQFSQLGIDSPDKKTQPQQRQQHRHPHSSVIAPLMAETEGEPESASNSSHFNLRAVSKLRPFAFYSRLCLALLLMIGIAFCVYFGYQLDQAIIGVQDNWDNSYAPYDECITHGQTVERYIANAIVQCDLISQTPSAQPIYGLVNQTRDALHESLDDMQHYLGDAQELVWGDSAEIDPYRKLAIFVGLSILGCCAILLILSICTSFLVARVRDNHCRRLHSLLSMVLVIGMLCVWLISVWQFAFSVQVSDACDQPQGAILQAANSKYASDLEENTTLDIVEYYIYCDAQHSNNPLQTNTQQSYDTLVSINQTVYQLVNSSAAKKMGIVNETTQLYFDYVQSLNQIVIVNESLDCTPINNYLNDITYDLCDSGVEYWLLLYCTQAAIVCLLVVRFCCACTVSSNGRWPNATAAQANKQRAQERLSEYLNEQPLMQDNSMQLASYYDRMAVVPPTFTDQDVRRCIRYLLPFISDRSQLAEKAKELRESGYPKSATASASNPLHNQLVSKAMAILRNYDATANSSYHHPLLDGLV